MREMETIFAVRCDAYHDCQANETNIAAKHTQSEKTVVDKSLGEAYLAMIEMSGID